MSFKTSTWDDDQTRDRTSRARQRRRLATSITDALRALSNQLSLLDYQVGSQVALRQVDLNCLDVLLREGPMSPSTLARQAGLHPATVTGILDRLERGSWASRERDPSDRRAVVVRVSRERMSELLSLYSGMKRRMDDLFSGYSEEELQLLADFLTRTTDAGRHATNALATGNLSTGSQNPAADAG